MINTRKRKQSEMGTTTDRRSLGASLKEEQEEDNEEYEESPAVTMLSQI
jgi:hypothetical protein